MEHVGRLRRVLVLVNAVPVTHVKGVQRQRALFDACVGAAYHVKLITHMGDAERILRDLQNFGGLDVPKSPPGG